ncbi:tetratricopeptide repeat protein [Panacagrimonas sp.]|uniref:tetratricopeptide repeat protein n=1 Tax=Panacagrimonas sp. TaxID=2480088 RepID=UPI003B52050F
MKRTISCLTAAAAFLFYSQGVLSAAAVQEAQTLIEQGQLDRALQRLDEQLKSAPQDAEARFLRGLVLTRLNRAEDAIKAFADITRDYPQLPEPYNNLAVLYAQQGDYEKARDALEAALATHPSYATAHENLGDIYAALAGAAYNRALMLDQGNQTVRNKLSFLNRISGDQGAAVAAAPAAPAAPAAAAPAATALPAAPAPTVAADEVDVDTTAAVRQALLAWAQSWSRQDVEGYLGAYAGDFRPEGGVARATWEAQRRDRIARPARIQVNVVGPQFVALADGTVRVTFRQEYESDSFSDQVTKVIEMRDEQGWKIVREYTR